MRLRCRLPAPPRPRRDGRARPRPRRTPGRGSPTTRGRGPRSVAVTRIRMTRLYRVEAVPSLAWVDNVRERMQCGCGGDVHVRRGGPDCVARRAPRRHRACRRVCATSRPVADTSPGLAARRPARRDRSRHGIRGRSDPGAPAEPVGEIPVEVPVAFPPRYLLRLGHQRRKTSRIRFLRSGSCSTPTPRCSPRVRERRHGLTRALQVPASRRSRYAIGSSSTSWPSGSRMNTPSPMFVAVSTSPP